MKRRLSLLLAIAALISPSLAASERPNVILIVTDDQGYGDLSAHGNPVLKTPNMDKLRESAVRFTDFHVAPMCSPTRGQLMTGIDAMRNGCTAVCQGRSMMRSELPTMANFFAGSGYSTGHFGKWHLGDSYPHRPQDRDFQETIHHRAWGITSLADHWENHTDVYFDPILEHNGVDKKFEGYCTDIFFREAMKWMEQQKAGEKPFFVYLPTNTPHVPDVCAEQYSKPYEGMHVGKPMPSKFYGMIANLDENIGKLEAFLEANGLKDNTLLIYMSDNGTQSSEAMDIYNAGMREKKTSVYEGGHRVPLFVRWPEGKLQHGTDIDELTQVQDLLPTLIELCELKNETGAAFDGTSLAGLLNGTDTALPDRKLVVQYRESGEPWDPAVVMMGKWRLLKGKKSKALELYHVGRDPGQQNDLATARPKVFEELKQHYETWHAEAKPLFDRERWITLGNDAANPMALYAQDWIGDYCDNSGGLSQATAQGYWNVIVERPGTYEIELRRWPKESNKSLTEGWKDGPGGVKRSARPIAAANLQVAGTNHTLDTQKNDTHATFRIQLPAGKTQLSTTFMDAKGGILCSAIYTYVRRLDGEPAELTPPSDRKPSERDSAGGPQTPKSGPTKPITLKTNDILIADFEGATYGNWTATGSAFGEGTTDTKGRIEGHQGQKVVDTFLIHGSDAPTGTLTSPSFTIERRYLNLLVGGGRHPGETGVALISGDQRVQSVTGNSLKNGNGKKVLRWTSWDVSALKGKQARLEIFDEKTGGWGHIVVDQIFQSDQHAAEFPVSVAGAPLEKKLTVDNSHLIVPVANKGERTQLGIFEGDRLVQDFTVALPQGDAPHWLAAYPLEHFELEGKEIRIAPSDKQVLPGGLEGAFNRIRIGTAADALDADDYTRPFRDQFHVTTRRGWVNDPNGMVYHDGMYHLYFQHNPFGIQWGNMHWGHVESSDLIHWEEKPIALFQNTTGDMMFSGGGFVDFNNSAGLGAGTLFVAFTSHGRGECLASSQDGGLTFSELPENPVVKHEGRDPKVIWYEPEQKWVMVIFNNEECSETRATPPADPKTKHPNGNMVFYESKNLRQWTRTGAFTDPDRMAVYECPELFELPVAGKPDESRWVLYGAQNRYFLGHFDGKTFLKESGPHGQPRGAIYAAQTFSDTPDGRRIQIGWIRTKPFLDAFPGQIVSQSFSLPQEFTLRETPEGLRVFMEPVEEVEGLRDGLLTDSADGLHSCAGGLCEVLVEFENAGRHELMLDGIETAFIGKRARIFVDRTFCEIYIDGGAEYQAVSRAPQSFGKTESRVISGSPVAALKVYRMKSIWK